MAGSHALVSRSSTQYLFILLACILVFYSLISHFHYTSSSFSQSNSREDLQSMLDKTSLLLNSLKSLPPNEEKKTSIIHNNNNPSNLIECHEDVYKADIQHTTQELQECQQRLTSSSQLSYSSVVLPSALASVPSKKWLSIGIPTVARSNNEDYLLRTLSRLDTLLPKEEEDVLFHNVLIIVVNIVTTESNSHTRFEEAKALYSSSPYFTFHTIISPSQDNGLPVDDIGDANYPGFRVRKQTRDLAAVMHLAIDTSRYYLFAEDDMLLCRQGFISLHYMISKAAQIHPNFIAIRASYGMNGIILHTKDLPIFQAYLVKHQARRPPDHLVVEWFAGETDEAKTYRGSRQNVGFKYNLFEHIGRVSTLRKTASGAFPMCYDLLLEPTVFQVEAFSPNDCPKNDIWPCKDTDNQFSLSLDSLK